MLQTIHQILNFCSGQAQFVWITIGQFVIKCKQRLRIDDFIHIKLTDII